MNDLGWKVCNEILIDVLEISLKLIFSQFIEMLDKIKIYWYADVGDWHCEIFELRMLLFSPYIVVGKQCGDRPLFLVYSN